MLVFLPFSTDANPDICVMGVSMEWSNVVTHEIILTAVFYWLSRAETMSRDFMNRS